MSPSSFRTSRNVIEQLMGAIVAHLLRPWSEPGSYACTPQALLPGEAHLAFAESEPDHLDGEALQEFAPFHEALDSDVQPGLAPDRGTVARRVASTLTGARSALAPSI